MAKSQLTISTKSSVLDVGISSEHFYGSFFPGTFYVLLDQKVSNVGKIKE